MSNIEGINFTELQGFIKFPRVSETRNGHTKFQGKLAIPHIYTDNNGEQQNTMKYVKIAAWRDKAEAIGQLPEDTPVRIHGSYNERSWDGSCKDCGSSQKKYWSEILVDAFEVLNVQ